MLKSRLQLQVESLEKKLFQNSDKMQTEFNENGYSDRYLHFEFNANFIRFNLNLLTESNMYTSKPQRPK